ncbi:MAG: DUF2505 domain-containing protein [Nocardioides sp.]|uniref:DUF2505 domain-containing protein n=1 Tax=Nocardioides sp. TaxID=35761 RepID=UPI003264FFD5
MSTTISEKLTYPGATLEQVVAMLADPAFREQVATYQTAVRSSASNTGTGAGSTARIEIVHGTEHVPSYARKFVGDEISIVQDETWTTDTHADVRVTIPGKPGDMTGTYDLAQVGDDVVQDVKLTVKVNIPFVGGKVEDLIAGLLSKAYRAENKVGLRWLAGA